MTKRLRKKENRGPGRFPRGLAILAACLLSLSFLPPQPLLAADGDRNTYLDKAEIEMAVNADGTVDITETLAFRFLRPKRSISFDLIFPLEGEPQLVKFEFAQRVAEGQEKYIQIPLADELKSQPFSYTTARKRDRIRIEMKMTRLSGDYLFRISYEWNRGVVQKEGKALVWGPLLAVRPESRVDTMRWTIKLPESCPDEEVEAIPMTVQPLTINKSGQGTISLVSNQAFRKLDGMGIFLSGPSSCFPLILPSSDKASLADLVDRAQAQNKRLSRLGAIRDQVGRIVFPLVAAGLLIYLLLYLLQAIRIHKLDPAYACWPATGPPALTAKLYRIRPSSSYLLLGTLLQLINRKEIEWHEEVFIWKQPGRNDFSSFSTWEILILQWLFAPDDTYDHVLAPERLRRAARREDFRELAQRFEKQVDQAFQESGLIRAGWTKAFRLGFWILAFLFISLALLFFLVSKSLAALSLLGPAAIFSFGAISFRFMTEEGVKRYREIFHFKRRLKRPGALIESCRGQLSDVESLISILPAAIVLGRGKDYFEGLRSLAEADFLKAAYGLLHVYRRIPAPQSLNLAPDELRMEIHRLRGEMGEMERLLSAWKAYFDSCFI